MPKTTILTKKALYRILPFLILSILPVITYCNTLNNDFVFDDLALIQGSKTLPALKDVTSIISVLTQKNAYRPVRTLSYAIDYHFSGINPLSYHISNISYHIITTLLVYLVTLSILSNRVTAFITALLFAVHPVHTDSVTYLAGRRDILCVLFYLMGFYFFLTYRKTGRVLLVPLTMVTYLLSVGSKEMGVTLPVIFFIYDMVNNFPQERKESWFHALKKGARALKRVVKEHKYFYSSFLAGALTFTYYKVFISSPSHQEGYYGDSMWVTFLTVAKIIVHYMKLLIFPVKLLADYSYDAFPLASSLLEGPVLSSLILIVIILFVLVKLLIINKWLAFGGIWFFITLLPVCHIIPHHELLAEHYLYLPSYGFCLIAALLFTTLLDKKRYSFLIIPSLLLIIILFSLRTIDRNRDWKDGMALWSKTVKTVPRCARAQNNLGFRYLEKKKYDEAMKHFAAAIAIKPAYAEPYNNRGIAYKEQGFYDRAISSFTKAITLKKGYYDAQYNLANTFENKGQYDRSIWLYSQLLKKKPRSAQIHSNLGIVYQKQARLELAEEQFSRALKLDPANIEARNNLGVYYNSKGLYDKAIAEFKQILIINPDNAAVYSNLGTAFSNKGMHDSAIDALKEALRIKPDFLEAMNNLGTAYKDKGLYDQALETFHKILELNPRVAIPHLNLAIVYLYQKKDNKKALYHLERAIEIEPDMLQAEVIKKKIEELKQADSVFRNQ
jgi:tetratricopeptide (TPR) repeat protein